MSRPKYVKNLQPPAKKTSVYDRKAVWFAMAAPGPLMAVKVLDRRAELFALPAAEAGRKS